MAHSSFKILPDEENKTLFLVMDGDNNLTGDPKTIDQVLERRETTELRILRLHARPVDDGNGNSSDENERPKVKLTFEEILPENGEEDSKSIDSTVPPDFVDPFSQLDTEQMLKLKKALASEQAKQILGDKVTAMLDVLSLENNPTVFLQNSIKIDHSYASLGPSSDTKTTPATVATNNTEVKRPKGRPPKGDSAKASGSGLSATPAPSEMDEEKDVDDEYDDTSEESDSEDRSSDSDYRDRNSGFGVRGRKKSRGGRTRGGMRGGLVKRGRGRPRREVLPIEGKSGEREASPVTPVLVTPVHHVPGKRGRPRKDTGPTLQKTSAPPAITPVDPTPIDHAAAKVYSADAIRLGRPSVKSEEERKRDMARILQSLDGGRGRRVIILQKGTKLPVAQPPAKPPTETPNQNQAKPAAVDEQLKDVLVTLEDGLEQSCAISAIDENKSCRKESLFRDKKEESTSEGETQASLSGNVMGGKYPRRENRKLPSHLADTWTLGPELFSAPDTLRKKPTEETLNKPNKKVVQRSLLRYVRKNTEALNPNENIEGTTESAVEEMVVEEARETARSDTFTSELQSMLEEGLTETVVEECVVSESPSANADPNVQNPSSDISKVNSARRNSEKEISAKKLTERRRSSGRVDTDKKTVDEESVVVVVNDTPANNEDVPRNSLACAETAKDVNEEVKSSPPPVVHSSEDKLSNPGSSRQTRRSSNESKVSTSAAAKEDKADDTETEHAESFSGAEERRRNASKRRRSDEISELDSDSDDTLSEASWNSEDDPERLWCICRKPHNNRFMICCDVCEDWFHGKCVGITKSIGKQMEQDGLEWSCPSCTKKKRFEEKEKESKLVLKVNKEPQDAKGTVQTKLEGFAIKRSAPEELPAPRKCIMCKAPVRENSIYCSDQCIRKHSQRAIAQLNSTAKPSAERPSGSTNTEPAAPRREERHVIVMDPTSKKVLTGQSAPTIANLATWLQQNPSFHVLFQKKVAKPQAQGETVKKLQLQSVSTPKTSEGKPTQLKLTVSPNSKHIKIISRVAGQPILKVIPTVSGKKIVTAVKSESEGSPSIKVKQEAPKATERKVPESPKPVPRRRKEKHTVLQDYKPLLSGKMEESKEKLTGSSTSSGGGAGEQAIRDSVRKTLGDSLKARMSDCKDLDVKVQDIDDLATKIEDRLYRLFENKVDVKYKSKYRSLVFNIKDQKNETLFRKILEKSISPKELVRLTADEMASQELAQWREKENQHQLEIIKKTELELMTLGQTFIMKSHKGEEVIGKDQKVAAVAAEIDPNTSAKELVSALNSVSSTTPDVVDVAEKERDAETSLMKMKKKEKERRREKEKKHKRERDRSNDRSRSKHSKNKKRSRSRSRDRRRRSRERKDHKDSRSRSSRHTRNSRDVEKIKDSNKEKKEERQGEERPVTSSSEDIERHPKELVSDEADYEPTSTVTIQTPEPMLEEPETVWSGQIVMAEVAKFRGRAVPAVGDCTNVAADVGENLSVVGRIAYDAVWDYIARMKKATTKDIIVLQIVAIEADVDRNGFSTLYSYLSKRSRIGVIGRISDQVKDFYLYPYNAESPVPAVLHPLSIPLTHESGNVLLGIIVRSKRGSRPLVSVLPKPTSTALPLPPTSPTPSVPRSKALSSLPLPGSPPKTPPLPDVEVRTDPRKRKVRVQVQVAESAMEEEEDDDDDDDDSPYSPASSDDDLPPLSKIPKKVPATHLPTVAAPDTAKLSEAAQIDKKIEEMNRAIEEQTQQIQTLASTVPLLPIIAPALASTLPRLQSSATAPVPQQPSTSAVPQLDLALALKTINAPSVEPKPNDLLEIEDNKESETSKLDIPLPPNPTSNDPNKAESEANKEADAEPYSPSHSLSPEPAPPGLVLPEVAQISIPSNLQEILASIQHSQPPADTQASPPVSPPTSPPESPPASPEPLPPGVDASDLPEPVKPTKSKPDRKQVFESEGVPQFETNKRKQIKFAFKMEDMEERLRSVPMDVDERTHGDRDDRVLPADRDGLAPSSHRDDELMVVQKVRDRDDRVMPMSSDLSRRDSRTRSRSSSTGGDERQKHSRRRSDSHRHRSDWHRDRKPTELEAEWEGSIRRFEEDVRHRNRQIRTKEIERLKQRVEED